MIHYVPASLDNLTVVVEYVLDSSNRHEMKMIVASANSWCQHAVTKDQLTKDAIAQLIKYENALYTAYEDSWVDEWIDVRQRIMDNVGTDLVDCS